MRELNEDAGTVSGVRIAAGGPAMQEAFQHGHAFEDDVMRSSAFNIADHADAASVVLVLRMVKSLWLGEV